MSNSICRAVPLGVLGGLSADESQLLGIELGMFGVSEMNMAVYGEEVLKSTTLSNLFGLSTGRHPPPPNMLGLVLVCTECRMQSKQRHSTRSDSIVRAHEQCGLQARTFWGLRKGCSTHVLGSCSC